MDLLSSLNPAQQAAVLHTEGPLLILAGAGSGKTRVITTRMAHLIASGLAMPGQVLAVTFTNKAAEEMRHRVEQLLGEDCRQIWLSTFHSLCARLLRREAPAIGLERDFVIYDSSDQLSVVRQALKELDIDDKFIPARVALARISQAKNRMETPEDLRKDEWNHREAQISRIFELYRRTLDNAGALDFDDLLLRTVDLLEKGRKTREFYAHKFKYILVDEYQDTNRPQYLLIRRLAEVHRNLCVVGDPDQSIYRWRGADLRNILDFERDFPDVHVVKLEQNYRSTQVILDAASAVISRNRQRRDKQLWTDQAGGERILYVRAADEIEEADFITRTIRESNRASEHVTAVLYRTNAQSRAIEDALMREGVPYRIIGGVRFYERKEIKDALAYMRLLINPHDDVSFRRVVNVPARGIGRGVFDSVEQVEIEQPDADTPLLADPGAEGGRAPRSLWTRLAETLRRRQLQPRALAALKSFHDLIAGLHDEVGRTSVSVILGLILDRTGYLRELRESKSEEAEARLENLMELVSAAQEYEMRDDEPSLGGFVDRLSLLSEAEEADGASPEAARVWLMSMHAAKGLEFPTVIVAGMEDGLFPHARSIDDPEEIEEERRLCYVCMTRARQRLILTGASRRRVFGEYKQAQPSGFLDEIPDELINRVEPAAPQPRWQATAYELRNPYARRHGAGGYPPRARDRDNRSFAYESEDQSASTDVRTGMKVRHRQFGVGTVIAVEDQGDDYKVTVRFAAVGTKKLMAKYAGLERA
jgi:DNA helicase-2/ATP-dependent DNA helicase PcrA